MAFLACFAATFASSFSCFFFYARPRETISTDHNRASLVLQLASVDADAQLT
jgi:hypothetical protein